METTYNGCQEAQQDMIPHSSQERIKELKILIIIQVQQ